MLQRLAPGNGSAYCGGQDDRVLTHQRPSLILVAKGATKLDSGDAGGRCSRASLVKDRPMYVISDIKSLNVNYI